MVFNHPSYLYALFSVLFPEQPKNVSLEQKMFKNGFGQLNRATDVRLNPSGNEQEFAVVNFWDRTVLRKFLKFERQHSHQAIYAEHKEKISQISRDIRAMQMKASKFILHDSRAYNKAMQKVEELKKEKERAENFAELSVFSKLNSDNQ